MPDPTPPLRLPPLPLQEAAGKQGQPAGPWVARQPGSRAAALAGWPTAHVVSLSLAPEVAAGAGLAGRPLIRPSCCLPCSRGYALAASLRQRGARHPNMRRQLASSSAGWQQRGQHRQGGCPAWRQPVQRSRSAACCQTGPTGNRAAAAAGPRPAGSSLCSTLAARRPLTHSL